MKPDLHGISLNVYQKTRLWSILCSFMSYFITLFKLLKTHQIERITPNGNEMLVGQVSPYQCVNPSILMNDPHTLPIADVDTPVHADCQALGKCQPGLGSWTTISTPEHTVNIFQTSPGGLRDAMLIWEMCKMLRDVGAMVDV